MSKRTKQRRNSRMIRAAAKQGPILAEAVDIEWIQAAEGEGESVKPKRFKMLAYTGGLMHVNNYGPPVVIDLAGLKAKAPIPILRDHQLSRVVGHADEIEVGTASLPLAGIISGAGPDATEVVEAAANGFPWKASVGARPDKTEFVGEGITTKVNGKTFTGPLYVARKSTLGEVSFVAMGADSKTSAKVAASAAQPKEYEMKFKEWIEAMGLDLTELREDQTVKLQAKYDLELKAAKEKTAADKEAADKEAAAIEAAGGKTGKEVEGTGVPPPVVEAPKFDIEGAGLACRCHLADIQVIAEEYRDQVPVADFAPLETAARKGAAAIEAKALREQWATPRIEAEHIKSAAIFRADLIVATRPKGPGIHSSTLDVSMPAIEAAFCKSAGLRDMEKHFKPEVLEASEKHLNIGIKELLLICARQNGYTGRERIGPDNLREVIRAAFSVHTITTLLTDVGNKILLEGFYLLPQSWREVAEVQNVTDFKAVTSYRLTTSLEYKEVGPGGAIEHGTASQESYEIQAKTYAKMLSLTRQDIINDDLGAFNNLRKRLGIGAAIAMNKIFWTAWLAAVDGAAFWTAARGNYQTGAATAFAEAGLNTAVKLYRDAKGPDGNTLGLVPWKVLVPSDLEATARKFYVSQEMRDTTADTNYPVANSYFNRFAPIVVPELSDATYTGFSATAWWLLCDPAVLASAAMCFLNGVQAPTIESTDADFNTLGIQYRGYHDFGVAMSEYRASVHSTGA